MTQSPVKT